MGDRICTECGREELPRRFSRGRCHRCYQRDRKAGTVPTSAPALTQPARIDSRISQDESGCWLWTGTRNNAGYATLTVGRRTCLIHRYQYERHVGPIPAGLVLDHLCRVRHCVNPAHLEVVTQRENLLRSQIAPAAINAAKTHCLRGHEYTPENTYVCRGTGRQCRQCNLDRHAAKRAATAVSS